MDPLVISGWENPVPLDSLKWTSRSRADDAQQREEMFMTESLLAVIDLDGRVAHGEARERHGLEKSANDVYYTTPDPKREQYFIEFKTGRVKYEEAERQLTGSIDLCVGLGILSNEETARDIIHYILVYNEFNVKNKEELEKAREEDNARKASLWFSLKNSSNPNLTLFGVKNLEKRYCKSARTMTEKQFKELFVMPMEEIDNKRVTFRRGNGKVFYRRANAASAEKQRE